MSEYRECVCGQMIRLRTWHDQLQWVHIETGKPHCLGPRAQPKPDDDD